MVAVSDQSSLQTIYTPGTSPYMIKGHGFSTYVAGIEANFPGGMKRALSMASPSVQTYLTQPLLASSWYDMLPTCDMHVSFSRVAGKSVTDVAHMAAEWQAAIDFRGMYGIFIKFFSMRSVMTRQVAFTKTYYNFSPFVMRHLDDTDCIAERHDFPACLFTYYSGTATGYMGRVATLVKAKDFGVTTKFEPTRKDAAGLQLGTLHYHGRWKN